MKELAKIIDLNKIYELQRRGLRIERIGTWIWVTGHTLQHKQLLKQYGFKFNRDKFAWSYHKGSRYVKKSNKNYTLKELRESFV